MNIIAELSNEVISELEANTEAVQAYLSQHYYDRLVGQNSQHLLVRLKERFDFAGLVALCGSYHSRQEGGRGQPAVHEVALLCRVLLLKHLYGWSYRQTVAEISSNTLVRWFVGYGLFDETMSYGTLHNFERWVIRQGMGRHFFGQTLAQIDEEYPEEREQP